MAAGLGAGRQHARAQPQLFGHPAALVVEVQAAPAVGLDPLLQVPLVQHDRRRAARPSSRARRCAGPARSRRRRSRRPRARRRRARRRAGSAGRCSTRPSRRPSTGGACPAVSMRISLRSPTISGMSIASRVVPATSETITRSSPRKRLTSEDLPTFGRPITARRTRVAVRLLLALGQQLDDPVEQVARAEALGGGDRAAARRARGGGTRPRAAARRRRRTCWPPRSPAAASGAAGRPSPRRRGARRRGRRRRAPPPARRPGPARAWSRIEPASGSSSSKSTPPVSISLKLAPVPLAVELLAVARDPRALVHDRLTGAREAVDQRGLAHVGIADDGDLHRAQYDLARRAAARSGGAGGRSARARRSAPRPPRRRARSCRA